MTVRRLLEAEARGLLERLSDSTRRDRAAFTLGYALALDAVLDHLPAGERAKHVGRARELQRLTEKEFL